MADPDMSDYELRNNSTVFEELEVSIVDFPSMKVVKIYKFTQYLDTIQIKIKGQMVTINAEINELKKSQSVSIFFSQKN